MNKNNNKKEGQRWSLNLLSCLCSSLYLFGTTWGNRDIKTAVVHKSIPCNSGLNMNKELGLFLQNSKKHLFRKNVFLKAPSCMNVHLAR
ncbi:MAG: hypothetical protein J3R72DRAFT_457760 [Linnemannia gamsii]|nr:MAG: hypothetical protein J3R72DRAFT_457760 [Linnemannia gamsii]